MAIWEKEILKKGKNLRRCPNCSSLSLVFDEKENRFHCAECGFEEYLPKMR